MKVKGAYLLAVELARDSSINVGALGRIDFKKGFYLYVGSALGGGGIIARIDRHLRPGKKPHWHIDYLMKYAHPLGEKHFPGNKALECRLSKKVAKHAELTIPSFGSSDCKCKSHLYYFKRNPVKSRWAKKL